MTATRQQLQYDVSVTLAEFIGDFDIPAIVEQLIETYGPLDTLDVIPTDEYWEIVKRYDRTACGAE